MIYHRKLKHSIVRLLRLPFYINNDIFKKTVRIFILKLLNYTKIFYSQVMYLQYIGIGMSALTYNLITIIYKIWFIISTKIIINNNTIYVLFLSKNSLRDRLQI